MIIRIIRKEDLAIRVEWMNNPKVYEFMHFDVPVSLDNTYAWFERNHHNNNRVDMVFEEDGIIVAFGGLTGINRETQKAELYIFVDPNGQRKGRGTMVTRLLCRYGFNELGLNKIFLETNEDNFAARRVYEKCGFKLEGVLREEHRTAEGCLRSRMYYGLLKRELCE